VPLLPLSLIGFRALRLTRLVAGLALLLAVLLPPLPSHAGAAEPSFASWLQGVRKDALAQGITPGTVDRALKGLAPIPRVIELDHRQPETTLTFADYIERVVTPQRRAAARQHFEENRALLEEVGHRYGVQPRFIVALWGIETDFGRVIGTYPVVAALATLAYDGRRSAFFRGELMNALKIIDRTHMDPNAMLGSWAGAMGQSQFMPSSFLRFAVSFKGDGAPDIWHNRADVFASIANYLARSGWHGDETWGRKVSLPASFDSALVGLEVKKPLSQWAKLGVRRADGTALPDGETTGSLIKPGGADGPTLLVYDNFRTLLKWNSSRYFATAVGYLADSLD
jgi:membrane-bound lytic murein transglycosylase B